LPESEAAHLSASCPERWMPFKLILNSLSEDSFGANGKWKYQPDLHIRKKPKFQPPKSHIFSVSRESIKKDLGKEKFASWNPDLCRFKLPMCNQRKFSQSQKSWISGRSLNQDNFLIETMLEPAFRQILRTSTFLPARSHRMRINSKSNAIHASFFNSIGLKASDSKEMSLDDIIELRGNI
jgi:hypothetical protein